MTHPPSYPRRRAVALALAGSLGGPLVDLCVPAFSRHARAADVPRFALGVASGCPRPHGLVLWTRLTGTGLPAQVEVQWEMAHDEAFTQVAARGREVAEAAWAHSVHAEPAGLAPGRWYWYRFTALGQRSAVGRTRTAPAADAPAGPLRFAIASCQRWDHGHYAAWRHLAQEARDDGLDAENGLDHRITIVMNGSRSASGMSAMRLDPDCSSFARFGSSILSNTTLPDGMVAMSSFLGMKTEFSSSS